MSARGGSTKLILVWTESALTTKTRWQLVIGHLLQAAH